jgi:hypothetical protein
VILMGAETECVHGQVFPQSVREVKNEGPEADILLDVAIRERTTDGLQLKPLD